MIPTALLALVFFIKIKCVHHLYYSLFLMTIYAFTNTPTRLLGTLMGTYLTITFTSTKGSLFKTRNSYTLMIFTFIIPTRRLSRAFPSTISPAAVITTALAGTITMRHTTVANFNYFPRKPKKRYNIKCQIQRQLRRRNSNNDGNKHNSSKLRIRKLRSIRPSRARRNRHKQRKLNKNTEQLH